PSVLSRGRREVHLRHRLVPAHEHGREARGVVAAPLHGRVGRRRPRRVRARRLHLHDRRERAVAPRRGRPRQDGRRDGAHREERPKVSETTALGAACLAGLGAGIFRDRKEVADAWALSERWTPKWKVEERSAKMTEWRRFVAAARALYADANAQ